MNEAVSGFLDNVAAESQGRFQAIERLVAAADVSKVFGQPVTSGEHTVITASEVGSGGGFGSGMGFGAPRAREREAPDEQGAAAGKAIEGGGGGGGGGGGSMGRPVAAIIISPDGVQVKPVFDLTKISLAALTAFGTMGVLALKMLKNR